MTSPPVGTILTQPFPKMPKHPDDFMRNELARIRRQEGQDYARAKRNKMRKLNRVKKLNRTDFSTRNPFLWRKGDKP